MWLDEKTIPMCNLSSFLSAWSELIRPCGLCGQRAGWKLILMRSWGVAQDKLFLSYPRGEGTTILHPFRRRGEGRQSLFELWDEDTLMKCGNWAWLKLGRGGCTDDPPLKLRGSGIADPGTHERGGGGFTVRSGIQGEQEGILNSRESTAKKEACA